MSKKRVNEETTTADIAVANTTAKTLKKQQDSLSKENKKELKEDTAKLVKAVQSLYDLYKSKFGERSKEEILKKVAQNLEIPTQTAMQFASQITEDESEFNTAELEHAGAEEVLDDEIKTLYDAVGDEQEVAETLGVSVEKVKSVIGSLNEAEGEEETEESDDNEVEEETEEEEESDNNEANEEEESEEDVVDGYVFGYKRDVLVIKGLEHPAAQDLAVAIMSNFRKTFQLAIDKADLHDLIITIEKKKDSEEESEE